ncbi:ARM repeat-containing protein, partial [Pluteus cervinus]
MSASGDDDFDEVAQVGSGSVWSQRESVLEEWQKSLKEAKERLVGSKSVKVKDRVLFLGEVMSFVRHTPELSLRQIMDVFGLLILTYPRYVDVQSRDAIESVGMELVRNDEEGEGIKLGVTEQILGWLSTEVGRLSKRGSPNSFAPSDIFVLLSWSCGIYTICAKRDEFVASKSWPVLVSVIATLFDMLNDSEVAKPSLKQGAVTRLRRALRSASQHINSLLRTALSLPEANATPLRVIPLVGLAIDVLVRLKNGTEPPKERLDSDPKTNIIKIYTNSILLSKIVVPSYISTALHDFIATFITPHDFKDSILSTIEKSLLRSPEYSLSVAIQFFKAYSHPLDQDAFKRVLSQIISSSKSSNPLVRSGSVSLFQSILPPPSDPSKITAYEDLAVLAITDLLALPKSGKSGGPDHRIALYTMLASIQPSPRVSVMILQETIPLLTPPPAGKETHEGAGVVLTTALPRHLGYVLRHGGKGAIENVKVYQALKDITTLVAKEMVSVRPIAKKSFCILAGSAFFEGDGEELGEGEVDRVVAFAHVVLPAFDKSLAAIASNPLTAGSILEGYVAVAVMLGPLAKLGKFDDVIAKNPALQAIIANGPKTSFVVWDKVYQKVNSAEEEIWLLRAVNGVLEYYNDLSEAVRSQLGLVFLQLGVDGSTPEIRKKANESLQLTAAKKPELVNAIVRDAFTTFLARGPPTPPTPASADDQPKPWNKQNRLSGLLFSVLAFNEGVEKGVREKAVADLIIFGHHSLVAGSPRQTWIDLAQKAGIDPRELVNRHLDRLFELILEASTTEAKTGFAKAGSKALTTLVFVSPETVLPRVIDQLRVDINFNILHSLTETDYAIWRTLEGTTYVDVLASNKEVRPTKGKEAAISKWEDDIRKSLANKKNAAPVTLNKQQQALVQAQLEKEAVIRQRVAGVKLNLERGLQFIRSVVDSHVDEFKTYLSEAAKLVSEGTLNPGSVAALLVEDDAFETYLALANCCSERLDTFRRWIGVASLRSLNVASVPEELHAEPINTLALRVLYRLRSLSEQAPFDAATFSYSFPLLSTVLRRGGISPADEDEGLEQLSLALDVIKFHSGEFSNSAFPREDTIQCLVHIIKQQPQLSKTASGALVEIGEAIHHAPTKSEVDLLLRSTLHQEAHVRHACLQAIQPFDLTDLDWSTELWIAAHDEDEQNARLARHAWEDNGLDVPEAFLSHLLNYLGHDNAYVRNSTAAAIAESVLQWPQSIEHVVTTLQEYYREKAKILAPEFDAYGMVIAQSVDRADPWPARSAAALAFEQLADSFTDTQLEPFFAFLIQDEALGDRISEVRREMLTAGTKIIDLHGAKKLAALISMFEKHLASPSAGTEASDYIQEAVVIFFGRVARHLDATDTRIPSIVDRLVDALRTPAEQVQIAVSDCLSYLVPLMRPKVPELVDRLLEDLFRAPKYAARRGAAYGLAGVIKGTGIGGMKEYNVMPRLRAAAEDKKAAESRQGVMFAFETLSVTLGRPFEPYITYALPLLLACFGDTNTDVREATQDAARIIMGHLSGYGVKLILPSLLEGLDEKQWRTKKGSIELLGMMAYCSPRQLSLSLPIVIPRLTGVLTDSHAQVKAAANKSLKQFGEVISNPEIQSLVPILLKALVDPGKTPNALSSLLKKSFMHYIDHSSLALVVPIIERGLRERGADTKKKAVQIVGNLASLTDPKDFVPYLNNLLPMVHIVLVDPVPEARATAAKALGTLVERLGEVYFPDLVPGLLRTLKTDTSGVDRQGAAQGLSEVLAGLGMERLEGLLPDIIANAQSPRPTVREGFMSLLVFLPATFGTRFQPHLPKIIPPILGGLSDTEEYVREAAMRAGRMVVTNYSNKAIDLLLPELEQGMFDPGWRIRQSSITLVGELLFKVSGISGKPSDLDDEEVAEAAVAETSRRALAEVLGVERRDRILAALYLVRQDGVVVVRQASIQIWKALVNNTPRTVREILPSLIDQIVVLLSGDDFEQQETASRTTTELCRKFGDRILGEIVPLLKNKSTSLDSGTREGVCLALSEIMQSATETQRDDYEDDIITMVRASLVDDEANVRAAAAKAFDILQDQMGAKAIDQTIPTLLEALRQPGKASGTALEALREVMSVRASTVFPVLIPTLTAIPMSAFNARALASLVTVAGNALSRRLTVILGALVRVLEEDPDDELEEAVSEALRALLGSISDAEGLNTLMLTLLGWIKHDTPRRRISGCDFFAIFCEESELDSSLYRVDWIRQLVSLLEDAEVPVHTAAWTALDVFVKSVPKDELEPLVVPLHKTIESTGAPGIMVPGFSLPKGVAPMVPIIIAGLTTGSNEQREHAAYAIGDIVERTEEAAIKPFVVQFTGPLIRVATQATTYPPGVKVAILSALTSMLERIPAFVKPFFPQLQRTFVKSASDASNITVRKKAAIALGVLMKNQPRVDPVVTELISGVKSSEEAIASSLVHALAKVIKAGSTNVGEKAREACVELVADAFRETHDEYYAQGIGALVASMTPFSEILRGFVKANLVDGPPSVLCSQVILTVVEPDDETGEFTTPNLFQELGLLREVTQKVLESAASERPSVARPAREARDH